jgi:acyl carrier protein
MASDQVGEAVLKGVAALCSVEAGTIDTKANLFALGIDSITLLMLVARIGVELGVDLCAADMLNGHTVETLVATIKAKRLGTP